MPTFVHFMREAAGRYVALDGRLWRTAGALLFRPGFLTGEYFAGRRRRYVRPARLFLVASLLLFAALRIAVELDRVELVKFDAPPPKAAAPAEDPATERNGGRGGGLRIDDDVSLDLGVEVPALKRRFERFKQLSPQAREAQIVDGIFRYGPYAMFLLLPAFALLLKLVYLGRRRQHPERPRLYAEHLVFAAHNHAFLFVAIVVANIFVGVLRAVVIVWMLVYMVWSMRALYGGSWLGIAARSAAIFVAYGILFGVATAGLVIVAILLR